MGRQAESDPASSERKPKSKSTIWILLFLLLIAIILILIIIFVLGFVHMGLHLNCNGEFMVLYNDTCTCMNNTKMIYEGNSTTPAFCLNEDLCADYFHGLLKSKKLKTNDKPSMIIKNMIKTIAQKQIIDSSSPLKYYILILRFFDAVQQALAAESDSADHIYKLLANSIDQVNRDCPNLIRSPLRKCTGKKAATCIRNLLKSKNGWWLHVPGFQLTFIACKLGFFKTGAETEKSILQTFHVAPLTKKDQKRREKFANMIFLRMFLDSKAGRNVRIALSEQLNRSVSIAWPSNNLPNLCSELFERIINSRVLKSFENGRSPYPSFVEGKAFEMKLHQWINQCTSSDISPIIQPTEIRNPVNNDTEVVLPLWILGNGCLETPRSPQCRKVIRMAVVPKLEQARHRDWDCENTSAIPSFACELQTVEYLCSGRSCNLKKYFAMRIWALSNSNGTLSFKAPDIDFEPPPQCVLPGMFNSLNLTTKHDLKMSSTMFTSKSTSKPKSTNKS